MSHSPDAPCDCTRYDDTVIVPAQGSWLVIDGTVKEAVRAYVNDITDTGTEWRVLIDDA